MDFVLGQNAVHKIERDEKSVVREAEIQSQAVRWRIHAFADQILEEGAFRGKDELVRVDALFLNDEEDVRQETVFTKGS